MYKDIDKHLLAINPIIAKVAEGNNLTLEEAKKAFMTLFLYDKESYHAAVFLSAIHAKGETDDELLGYIKTYEELAKPLNFSDELVTDLSGTGGGKLKTINVSTLASFIVAASGYKVC